MPPQKEKKKKKKRFKGVRNRFTEVKPVSNVSKAECPSALGKSKGNHTKANQEKTHIQYKWSSNTQMVVTPPPDFPFFFSIIRSFVSKQIRRDWGRILSFIPTHIWTSFCFFPSLFSYLLCTTCLQKEWGRRKKRPLHLTPPKGTSHTPFKAAQRHTVHQTKKKKKVKTKDVH